MRLLHICVVQ